MNTFDILALGFISISCFIVGYMAGKRTDIKEEYEQVKKQIKKSTAQVGPINRPSPEKVIQWTKPSQEEEDEAFKASFIKDIGDPTKKVN